MEKIIAILLILITSTVLADNNERVIYELRGEWKFKLGDDPVWKNADYDDSFWDNIKVPARWENQGYQGYNGHAWYRNQVIIPKNLKDEKLAIKLGFIDDVDEVFFNGIKIGQSGSFPPNFYSAYNAFRNYNIPSSVINYDGKNTIAVRVYDTQVAGGIISGDIELISKGRVIQLDINLAGKWAFNKGYSPMRNPHDEILVPGAWENQGYYYYDGYAVYQRKFNVPQKLVNERLVLLMGKIDDSDQVFVNGQLVGSSGPYEKRQRRMFFNDSRNYFIPPGLLKDGENSITVKVYDYGGKGGIIEGEIGLVTQKRFRAYWHSKNRF